MRSETERSWIISIYCHYLLNPTIVSVALARCKRIRDGHEYSGLPKPILRQVLHILEDALHAHLPRPSLLLQFTEGTTRLLYFVADFLSKAEATIRVQAGSIHTL